jgi:hypothetical protein
MPLALTDRQLKKVMVAASLIAPPLRDDFLRAIAAVTRDLPALSDAHHARSSGFFWRPGLIVTADEALSEEGDFAVTLGEALIGAEGEIVSWQGGDGRVRVKGEIWLARSDASLTAGSRVKVVSRDGLVLRVEDIRPA